MNAAAEEVVQEGSIDDWVSEMASEGYFEPGRFYDDISNHRYHRGPGCSSSNLKQIARSPLHYLTEREHPKQSTPDMMFGTAFHTLLLEPDTFDDEYIVLPPDAPARPTAKMLEQENPKPEIAARIAFWDQWDAESAGKIIIGNKPGDDEFWKPGDWDKMRFMRDAVLAHPFASLFFQRFIPERSMYWHEPIRVRMPSGDELQINELAKARFDGIDLTHNFGFDVKTARDASYSGFTRAIVDYGYHLSRQWYMRGQAATGHALDDFAFIVVEKEPPWAVGVYTIDQRMREIGDSLIKTNLEVYSRCRETKEWPCYPPAPRELQTPRYAEFIKIS